MDESSRETVQLRKYTYYQVYQYYPQVEGESTKRLIYTFNNEMAAHDLVEFILRNDFMPSEIGVEEHETPA